MTKKIDFVQKKTSNFLIERGNIHLMQQNYNKKY